MSKATSTLNFLGRTATFAAVFATGVAVMSAQTAQVSSASQPTLNLQLPAIDTSSDALFSSSSAEQVAAPVNEASIVPTTPDLAAMMQYGGGQRQRYGKPRYRGANTNADGSSKYIFFGGAGLAQPIGNTWHYYTPSYGFQVGGGRQFSKKFALPIQFDYDHLGLTGQTLYNQINLYNNDINYYCNNINPTDCATNQITPFSSLDGNAHIWSFTVDPTYTFLQGETVGAYAVAGVGFYHKVTNFTTPTTGVGYDPYGYGYYQYVANQIVDHYTSNAPGFNAGLGLTYKFSRFANERFYAEVRYVFIDNSYRPGVTINSNPANTYNLTNDFPANSNHTTYFPIKFGIRF